MVQCTSFIVALHYVIGVIFYGMKKANRNNHRSNSYRLAYLHEE